MDFVSAESMDMVMSYIRGSMKTMGRNVAEDEIESLAAQYLERCYKSYLDDDYNTKLTSVIKKLESEDRTLLN